MAVDMFIDIEAMKGESLDEEHKDQIDVLAWSWGLSQTGTYHVGSGGGAGKANFQDLSFTKYIDKATPILMQYCATGKEVGNATLYVRKAGGKPLEYVVIELNKVMVSSVSSGGSGGEERLTENVTLNFAEVIYKYTLQKEDGSKGAESKFGYDISANKEV